MANKKLPVISHNEYAADVRGFLAAQAAKKLADKASREADNLMSLHKARLFAAMEGNPTVACGDATITVKPGTVSPGALTLETGGKILLSDVLGVVVGQEVVAKADIKTWFGGRVTGDTLDIGGTI